MTTYAVKDNEKPAQLPRLITAISASAALKHVANGRYHLHVPDKAELIDLMVAGVRPESADPKLELTQESLPLDTGNLGRL